MAPWVFAVCAGLCLVLRVALAGRRFDATGLTIAFAPFNAAALTLRRTFAWSRGKVTHWNEAKTDLFAYAGTRAPRLEKRERQLRKYYDLEKLHLTSGRDDYRENLYVLDLLDRHVARSLLGEPTGRSPLRAIDVGSKDFRYAFGLARWLGDGRDAPSLLGIELDGHPIYADLHARKDHGEAYAAEVDGANVSYKVGDFLEHEERDLDVAFFFFPFVLEYALLRWGLPRSYFLPERIFRHAHGMLRPGGLVVVMNHTEQERVRQLELLALAGFEVVASGAAKSELVDYAGDVPERSLTVARRRA